MSRGCFLARRLTLSALNFDVRTLLSRTARNCGIMAQTHQATESST
jgi:hypothetical protein